MYLSEDSSGGLQRTPDQAGHFHAASLQTWRPNAAATDGSPGAAFLKDVTLYLATASDVSVGAGLCFPRPILTGQHEGNRTAPAGVLKSD